MDINRKKVIMIAIILFTGTTIAAGAQLMGWFNFKDDKSEFSMDDIRMTDSFELKDLPLWFEASVNVTGSGYVGQEHDVDISIFHTKPDSSVWEANGNFALFLENPDGTLAESITSGSFSDLIKGTPYVNPTYAWTPGVEAQNYTIALTIQNVYWNELAEYTITATAGPGGTISPSGELNVLEGESPIFTATVADGYSFDSFLIDGDVSIISLGSYTFDPVYADHTIKALFVDNLKPTVVSATADPDPATTAGTVTVTIVFSEAMNTTVFPNLDVRVSGTVAGMYTVSKSTYTDDTWVGTFNLEDHDEQVTATISVTGGQDLAGNIMIENFTAGTFQINTTS